jgi:hypothetical protein
MSPKLTLCGGVVLFLTLPACGSNTSSAPTPQPTPTVRPAITITSISVSSEKQSTGYAYRAIVGLKESAGVAATISSVDLAFISGTSVLVSQHDKPISDSSNVVPANGSIATKELMTVDADASHSVATTVRAQVTFTDGASFTGTATGSADVPAPPVPEPQAFTLTGVITDVGTRAGIEGARLEIVSGANAGKSAMTDRSGAYMIRDLSAGSFRLRASATGYDAGEQGVTVPANPRADFELRRPVAAPCNYTVAPNTSTIPSVSWEGGQLSVTITRTSGTCSWQANTSDAWITFPRGASGSDSGTLTYAVAPNGLNNRSGTIVVAWNGGSARVGVTQGPRPDFECFVSISKGPQDFDNVPSGGGTLAVGASVFATPPGWPCTATVSSSVSWMSGGGTISGPSTMMFAVAANPSPGTSRTATISVGSGGKTASVLVTQR